MPDETAAATPQLSDEVLKKFSELIEKFFDDLWSYTGNDNARLNSALLGYFDRVVLLAGGSLTLTFTVVANLSVHLQSIHRYATRPWLVVACLWLFVCSIICGLLCTFTAIKAQTHLSTQTAVSRAHSSLLRGLLQLNPNFEPNSLEPLKELLTVKSNLKPISAFLSILTHVSLVLAFIFIVLFLQGNMSLLMAP